MDQVTEGKRVFSMSPQAPAPQLKSTNEESLNMQEKISKAAMAEKLVVAMSDQARCSIARYALALKTTLTGNPNRSTQLGNLAVASAFPMQPEVIDKLLCSATITVSGRRQF